MKHTKLPTTHRQLQNMLAEKYAIGYREGKLEAEAHNKDELKQLEKKQAYARMEALKAATALASALGQSIGELSRAMCSERGQL
jgi:hypothetical protein